MSFLRYLRVIAQASQKKRGVCFDEMMGTLRTAEDPDRLYRQRASKGKNRWKWIDIAFPSASNNNNDCC